MYTPFLAMYIDHIHAAVLHFALNNNASITIVLIPSRLWAASANIVLPCMCCQQLVNLPSQQAHFCSHLAAISLWDNTAAQAAEGLTHRLQQACLCSIRLLREKGCPPFQPPVSKPVPIAPYTV